MGCRTQQTEKLDFMLVSVCSAAAAVSAALLKKYNLCSAAAAVLYNLAVNGSTLCPFI